MSALMNHGDLCRRARETCEDSTALRGRCRQTCSASMELRLRLGDSRERNARRRRGPLGRLGAHVPSPALG